MCPPWPVSRCTLRLWCSAWSPPQPSWHTDYHHIIFWFFLIGRSVKWNLFGSDLTSLSPWARTWALWWRRPGRGWGCPPGPRWWPLISPAWCSPDHNNYNLSPRTPISCLNNCSHPHTRPVANLDVVSGTWHKPQIIKLNSSHRIWVIFSPGQTSSPLATGGNNQQNTQLYCWQHGPHFIN